VTGRTNDSCLLLDHAGQAWRIDREGTHPREITLPRGDESLMTSQDLRRCTARNDSGGFGYWRDGVRVRNWPEATSAAISEDGRSIVVTLPGTVEVWEDEASEP